MELDLNILKPQERVSLQLRLLYERAGFSKYHMGRFEEYGLYQENRRFLSSEQVITFTDLDGRLLALKPDVTLSIAKNAQVESGGCGRYYYMENVYRPSQESHTFREISQMGLECIGAVDDGATAQAVPFRSRATTVSTAAANSVASEVSIRALQSPSLTCCTKSTQASRRARAQQLRLRVGRPRPRPKRAAPPSAQESTPRSRAPGRIKMVTTVPPLHIPKCPRAGSPGPYRWPPGW